MIVGAAYFTMFVWGVGNRKDIFKSVRLNFGKAIDDNIFSEFMEDHENALKNPKIGNTAFEYALSTKSLTSVQNILDASEIREIQLSISDKIIEKLLISFEDKEWFDIIQYLLEIKNIVLVYQKQDFNKFHNEVKNFRKDIEECKSPRDRNRNGYNLTLKQINEDQNEEWCEKDIEIAEIKLKYPTYSLPHRIAKAGEFIVREHLIEIAFRCEQFNRKKDMNLIKSFYPEFHKLTK